MAAGGLSMPRVVRTVRCSLTGLLVGLVALAALLMIVLVAAEMTATMTAARLAWTTTIICHGATMLAALQVVRRLPAGDVARRFWSAVAGAAGLNGVGFVVQVASTPNDLDLFMKPVTQVLCGCGVALLVIAMFAHPGQVRSGSERLRFWLDIATVMVASGAMSLHSFHPGADGAASIFLSLITGPVISLVAVLAVAKTLLLGHPPFGKATGLFGAIAAVLGSLLTILGPDLIAAGHPRGYLLLGVVSDLSLLTAAWVQRLQIGRDQHALAQARRRPYSLLPYAALAGTFGLLVVALIGNGLAARTWVALAGAVACTGLVVARQLAAFAENSRLLGELDATVGQLRDAEAVLREALQDRDDLAARLHDMAFRDSLTGLANRAMFQERLSAALAAGNGDPRRSATLLLDLDDFKPINDVHGHAAGDAVLRQVAARLRADVRDRDTVARLGGDEFALLIEDLPPEHVQAIAERILDSLHRPMHYNGVELRVGVSIGVACVTRDGDPDEVLRVADEAMYAAKKSGKAGYVMRRHGSSEPAVSATAG
jgi:diguanylate cyclase